MAGVTFDVLARDRASSTFRNIGRETDSLHSKFGRLAGTATKLAAGALVGGVAAGAAGVTAVLHTGVGEVFDYERGLAQLQQGLKTTGGVAGLSAQQMEALASKIQDYSGQTDDSIVATEQLLLTFTNIRNVAGKNNDIFSQTTKIAADMAARMGGDASTSAIKLGKALNDPVAGITALTRVGVAFTDKQKEQIKALTESGHTMAAQKIILAELNKEFGGSAKAVGDTLPGQIEKAKRKFEDFSQSIASAVLPLVFKFGGYLKDTLGPVFAGAGSAASLFGSVLRGNAGPTTGFLGVVTKLAEFVRDQLIPDIQALAVGFQTHALPALQSVANLIRTAVLPTLRAIGVFILEQVVPAVVKFEGMLLDGLRPAITQITNTIQKHRVGLQRLWEGLKAVADVILKVLIPVIGTQMKIQFRILGALISTAITLVAGLVNAFHDAAVGIRNAVSRIVGFVKAVPDRIKAAFGNAGTLLYGIGAAIIDGLWEGIKDGFGQVKDGLIGFTQDITRWKGPPEKDRVLLKGAGQLIMQGLIDGFESMRDKVRDKLSQVTSDIASIRQNFRSMASGIRDSLAGAFDIGNATNLSASGLQGFLSTGAKQTEQFVRQLHQLVKLGYPPGLVQQVAAMGVGAGSAAARSLIHATAGQRQDIVSLEHRLNQASAAAGQLVAHQQFDPRLAKLLHVEERVERHLKSIRDEIRGVKADIRGEQHKSTARTST